MPIADSPQIDALLALWGEGDRDALRSLMPLLYEELRRVARQQLRRVPLARTLQATALVNEAYLRLHQQFRVAIPKQSAFHCPVCAADAPDSRRLRAGEGGGEEGRRPEQMHAQRRARHHERRARRPA